MKSYYNRELEDSLRKLRQMNANSEKVHREVHQEWPLPETIKLKWEAFGLQCCVTQGPMGLCGYVLVSEDHPFRNMHYDEVPVDVHYGLTFQQLDNSGGMWFGWDTSHAGDWLSYPGVEIPGQIWTVQNVKEETTQLAMQLAKHND